MSVIANAQLITALLSQIPADDQIDAQNLTGDPEQVLFGLREMLKLGLVSADFRYGARRDPSGPLLTSASAIRLTKRGIILKR
jgi:hypothetical protein